MSQSWPADEQHLYQSFLEDAKTRPQQDRKELLQAIPVTPYPSSAPLGALSALLTANPGQWPTFDLLCCYARLWKHLPENAKAGNSDVDLLGRVSCQVKETYLNLGSLLPTCDRPAVRDGNSSSYLTHKNLASFVCRFSLPKRRETLAKPTVALALPNGPLLGLAIIAASSWYTTAPLTVASGPEQFRSDLLQSGANVVLAMQPDVERLGLRDKWLQTAGIQVLIVSANADMTFSLSRLDGSFVLLSDNDSPKPNGPDDVAVLLFTSGTSGTKKTVPITTHTMVSGIAFVIDSWGLQETDVCLNMMPLYHVGGIIRNLFAPIMAGGSTICCPAFDANLFWDIVEDHQPTWYYASPTMHSMILEEAHHRPEALRKSKMRLIANAAGGLLPSLAYSLRDAFDCTVLPSYGMTECMPISSPALSYDLDRPGTSGVSVGPEIGILNGQDQMMQAGQVGRIAVRGAPVFGGYLKSGDLLDKSPFLAAGWFDTGDMGYLDKDGFLFVTGRSKEVINRGGELISPFEVEEAIMIASQRRASPIFGRVSAALAFSMPHDVLQEVVGIVVVTPLDSTRACIKSIQEAVKDSLSQVKWPAFVVYMDDLPKNNNKILRVKLAERLGLREISDLTPLARRHYEARCPPVNSPLSMIITSRPCTSDLDEVTRKLSKVAGPGFDVYVRAAKTDGYPEAFLAPRHASSVAVPYDSAVKLTAGLRSSLVSDYALPSQIHRLDQPMPVDSQGAIDVFRLDIFMQQISNNNSTLSDMSDIERKVAEAFVRILSCSKDALSADSDFFHLGGDSLRAGRLLSELRKEFQVRLPVDVLFTHGQIGALAAHIDGLCLASRAPGGPSVVSPTDSTPALRSHELCSSTNSALLIIQLLPIVLFYPMKRALTWTVFIYALTASVNWSTATTAFGRLVNVIICLGIGRAVTGLVAPLLGITMKWLIMGRYKQGLYPMWGPYHTRWWLVQKILAICGMGHFSLANVLIVWYYRLLGAKIGRDVTINRAATLGEYDLLEIADGANLDKCICRGFAAERNTTMYLGHIRIGVNASVGLSSVVAPGTSVPDEACIGPNSSSWETQDADEGNRNLSSNRIPGAHFLLELLVSSPVALLVTFCRAGPWIGGLVGMVDSSPEVSSDQVQSTIDWFAEPRRIGWHYLALILNAAFGPLAWFIAVFVVKKLLDVTIGRLQPGSAASRGQLQRLRLAILKKVVTMPRFHAVTELFGAHYESASFFYRAMGAKIGKRVYWPGTGPTIQDFDLVDVGNDVVFGSRSHLVTSDATGSDFVRIGDGAMVSDRVVVLPGASLGRHTVLGSGALTRRDKHYMSDTVWVGSKNSEAICLSRPAVQTTTAMEVDSYPKELSKTLTVTARELMPRNAFDDIDERSPLPSPAPESPPPEKMCEDRGSTPFGRAFYEGKAPYYVLGLVEISLYSSLTTVITAFYWNIAPTSAVQVIARILASNHALLRPHQATRPLIVYALFTTLIALLMTAQAVLALALVVAAKWSLLGRRTAPANHNWDTSSYCQRWQAFLTLERLRRHCYGGLGILSLLTGTHWLVLYMRALGATVGADCALFAGGAPALVFTEPDLLTLGDRVCVDDASLVSHINSRGVFDLNPLVVGDRCVLRAGSRLLSGARMGADAVLLEHTLVMAGDVVDDGVTMQGWPADVFEGTRAVLRA